MPRLLKDGQGACKGCGWITFQERKAFEDALAWNGVPRLRRAGSQAIGARLLFSSGLMDHTQRHPVLAP